MVSLSELKTLTPDTALLLKSSTLQDSYLAVYQQNTRETLNLEAFECEGRVEIAASEMYDKGGKRGLEVGVDRAAGHVTAKVKTGK